MKKLILGVILGTISGLVYIGLMIKWPAYFYYGMIAGAFMNKFLIGYILALIPFKSYYILWGILNGAIISLPEALSFKEGVLPILGYGMISGGIINWVIQKFGK
jgi:hypothetical protein